MVAVNKASRGKSKRVQKTAQRHVYDIRYDCVQTNGTDVSYGVPEGELERRDVKIDPALMPPRPEDKQAWLREQFANYVGHDEVRKQIAILECQIDPVRCRSCRGQIENYVIETLRGAGYNLRNKSLAYDTNDRRRAQMKAWRLLNGQGTASSYMSLRDTRVLSHGLCRI